MKVSLKKAHSYDLSLFAFDKDKFKLVLSFCDFQNVNVCKCQNVSESWWLNVI